jgi:hypothetical protein
MQGSPTLHHLHHYFEVVMKRFTLTIKSKIILLAVVGILGLLISAAVNTVVNVQKRKDIALAKNSQVITQIILKEVLLSNTTSTSNPMVKEFSELHAHAKDILSQIQVLAVDEKTSATATTVVDNENQLAEIFLKITAINQTIDNYKNSTH